MKRSAELAALSRDHHVALAHALRLRRATPADLAEVAEAFLAFLTGPGRSHFALEETVLAPEVPVEHGDLVVRMRREHEDILRRGERLSAEPTVRAAHDLGGVLRDHVRFEERELFPLLEAALPPERLRAVARRLDHA